MIYGLLYDVRVVIASSEISEGRCIKIIMMMFMIVKNDDSNRWRQRDYHGNNQVDDD